MNIQSIARMVALYCLILGGVSVGGVYVLSHSGLYILILIGAGLLLAGLGGSLGIGSASAVGGPQETEINEMMGGHRRLRPSTKKVDPQLVLILYGIGLVFWSIIVFTFFSSGLH